MGSSNAGCQEPTDSARVAAMATRARCGLLTAALLVLAVRWLAVAFVQAPPAAVEQVPQLRGSLVSAAAAAAAAAAPLAAVAEDELFDYNYAGEFTPYFFIGYFGLTTVFTAFAFLSYLILTKLKII
mmetsp:Transcript_29903/g.69527  ORF Transcript_29903/g.69527 Transcript_29903/m.69527 type:complete len:127 (+) Transcript_29903:12-392(+)